MDQFDFFREHWRRLAKVEFEAGVGELDDCKSGAEVTFLRCVSVHAGCCEGQFWCTWEVGQNAGVHPFPSGSTVWFSRCHPQRDGCMEGGVVGIWRERQVEVTFRPDKIPSDLLKGQWRVDKN